MFDIECLEGTVVNELGIFKDGIGLGYTFLPPNDYKQSFQATWKTKNYMESTGVKEKLTTQIFQA